MSRSCLKIASIGCAGLALAGVVLAASEYLREPGYVAPASQRAGDPAKGYDVLVNEAYVRCGLPRSAYERIVEPLPELEVPGRRGVNASLPYGQTASVNDEGVEVVGGNCLTCHAAPLDGKVVIGLGNESLDFTRDVLDYVDSAGVYVRGETEMRAYDYYASRMEGIAPYIRTRTIGVNPATNLTWALMAHRDPKTMRWSDTPLIEPPPVEPLPLSTPPWWHMKKKHAMFYTALGRGDHARFMLLAAMMCTESVEAVEVVDAKAPHVRAYIDTVEAPPYPHGLDASLLGDGQRVFEQGCARCHGTYGQHGQYPNLVVPLEIVGTDAAYAEAQADGSEDRFYAWTAESPYGSDALSGPSRGYVAPPLDGIWATAPYLHNGSVPTLATLLEPDTRPSHWARRSFANDDFDEIAVGWAFDTFEAGAVPREPSVYDTTRHGYGNAGHRYGEELGAVERAALIEYLKTL